MHVNIMIDVVFRSGTDQTDLVSLFGLFFFLLLLFLLPRPLHKSLRLRRFWSDQDKIWQNCSSSEYASIDIVGFRIWRHSFKMAAKTALISRSKLLCCHLVSENETYAVRICSITRQFLIYRTFLLVYSTFTRFFVCIQMLFYVFILASTCLHLSFLAFLQSTVAPERRKDKVVKCRTTLKVINYAL